MEEVKQREQTRYAKVGGEAWRDDEEISAIADDLLTAPQVRERLALLHKARSAADASAGDARDPVKD